MIANDKNRLFPSSEDLYEAILELESTEECARFFKDLLTPAEVRAFAERWLIAKLLAEDKLSYREISNLTGASTTTVGRVARFLNEENYQGYKLIINRLRKKNDGQLTLLKNRNPKIRQTS